MESTAILTEFSYQESDQTHAFLLLCLRSRFEPRLRAGIGPFIAAHNLDWAVVEQRIAQERIAPLIYSVVREQEWIPDTLEKKYKQIYMRNSIENKIMLTELARISPILNDSGVPFIALKGAALLEPVYKNIGLRILRDLDLLIHQEHGELAFQILSGAGFNPEAEIFAGHALTFDKEMHFNKPGRYPINIDLHWHIFNSKFYHDYLPLDWFWNSAKFSGTENLSALVLSPEAQLLHLSGHIWLSKHAVEPMLLWMNDIAALIYAYENRLDWDLLLRQTEGCQLIYTVRHTLQKLRREWKVPIPQEVLSHLETMNPSPFELDVIDRYITDRSPLERARDKLSDAPNSRHRAALALRWLFPSPEFLRFRYRNTHPLALPFLYIYRGWLGVRLGFKMIAHHLFDK